MRACCYLPWPCLCGNYTSQRADADFGDIQGKTKAALDFIGGVFEGFKQFMAQFGLALIGIVRGAIGIVLGILNTLIDGWNLVAEHLGLPILGHIKVDTPGLDAAEAALNYTARSRTSNIYANVYEQAIAGGGGSPMYAEGTPFVPRTEMALVHRGERIIPASQNTGGGSGGGVTIYVEGSLIGLGVDDLADRIGAVLLQQRRIAGLA